MTSAGLEPLKNKKKFLNRNSRFPAKIKSTGSVSRSMMMPSAIDFSHDGPISSYKFLPPKCITKLKEDRNIQIKYVNAMGQGDERSILNAKSEVDTPSYKKNFMDLMKNSSFEVIKKSKKTNLLNAINSMKAWNITPNYIKARPKRDP